MATAFEFNLFARLAPGNVVFSPLGIATALSMAADGARGETAEQIRAVVGRWPPPPRDLLVANSIWARVPFRREYVKHGRTAYDAEMRTLESAAVVNEWVRRKTRGTIPAVVDDITDLLAILVNAIYFRREWQKTFDQDRTALRVFAAAGARSRPVPMMVVGDRFPYFETPALQGVSLPYANGTLSMRVLLPKHVEEFRSQFTLQRWNEWSALFSRRKGVVELPRFRVEWGGGLKPVLAALGLTKAFEGDADFSAMSEVPLMFSDVIHKACVEVNEQGTEAAASTGTLLMIGASLEPQVPFHMTVDRPFVFAIVDERTGSILFMGSVTDPG